MTLRSRFAFAMLAGCAALAAAASPSAQSHARSGSAPAAWTAGRLSDGHPDFQGVWANNTVTPLQRPKEWEGKTRLTDAEIGDLQ